jgi:hypothetical protein
VIEKRKEGRRFVEQRMRLRTDAKRRRRIRRGAEYAEFITSAATVGKQPGKQVKLRLAAAVSALPNSGIARDLLR